VPLIATEESHAVLREQLDYMLRLKPLWDHRFSAGGQRNEHARQEAVDVGEGCDGEENFAIGARGPHVLNAAHRSGKATVRVLNSLGRSSGAAAEQQCSGVCGRGGPQPEGRLGLGDKLPDCSLLPQANHAGNAQIVGETGHHVPRRRRTDHGAWARLPQ
jgi:hypothetical protein